MTEDKLTSTGGKLDVTDPDAGQASFVPQTGAAGAHGSFTVQPDGTWSYTLDNGQPAVQALKTGEQLTDTLTVSTVDGTTKQITVTINGTDDKAAISGTAVGAVTEDKLTSTGGKLDVTDPDAGQASFVPQTGAAGAHGSFTVQPDGTWSYTLDNGQPAVQALKTGEQLTDTLTVSTVDGTTKQITVTINGTDDKAIIGGVDTGSVAENTAGVDKSPDQHQPGIGVLGTETLNASGQLTILDPDAGEAVFDTHGLGFTYHGTYGDLNLRADGTWFYSADAGNARFFDGRPTTRGSAIDQLGEGQTLTDTITVYSKDGTAHDITITIHGSNDAPYCASEVTLAPGTEDTAQTLTKAQLLANTVEVDANDAGKLSIAGLRADHGSIRDNGDGTFTFTPARDYNGAVHFTYDVTDAHGGVTHTGATTTLAAVGDPATITDASIPSVTEDRGYINTHYELQVYGKLDISDPDPGEARFDGNIGPQTSAGVGYDTQLGGHVLLQPDGNFIYYLDNRLAVVQQLGAGQTVKDTVTIRSVDGTTHQIEITVHGTNDAPVLTAATASATEDGSSVTGQMSATDVDTGDTLTYSLGHQAPAGFSLNPDGSWSFDPTDAAYQHLAAGATEQVTIPVKVTDGTATDTQDLTITVTGTNDGPAVTGPVTLPGGTEDKPVQITAAQLLAHATDIDTGDQLSVTGLSASHGTITGDAAHGFTFTPDANYNGPVTLSYTVTDGHGGNTAQTANLTLAAVGDAAIIGGVDTGDVTENTAGVDMSPDQHQLGMSTLDQETIKASGTLTIIDADAGEASFDTHGPGYTYHGTYGDLMLRENGEWFYSADVGKSRFFDGRPTTRGTAIDQLGENQTLTDTITVHSKDGTPHDIVITIHGSNDRPYCSSEVVLRAGTEDTAQTLTKAQLLANTVDVDANDAGKLTIDALRVDHGSVRANPDGTYTFTPEKDYNGNVHFTYDVKDAHGGVTHTGATTTLVPVGDAAVVSGTDTGDLTEDKNVGPSSAHPIVADGTLSVSDPDGTAWNHFHYSIWGEHAVSDPFGGSLHIDRYGNWHYAVDNSHAAVQSLAAGEEGYATYRVSTADGTTHQIKITIHGTNDAPVLSAATASATEDGKAVSGQMSATDVDTGDTQTYSLGGAAPAGFTLNADGSWNFDPTDAAYQHLAAGQPQQITIPVTVTDKTGATDTENLVITVTGTNDGPSVSGPVALPGGTEDKTVQITAAQLLEHATDVDTGDQLSVTGLTASHGTITSNLDGSFTFTPDKDYNGPVSLSYQVTDGHGGNTAQKASLTLGATPDASIITGTDSGHVKEDNAPSTSGKLNISDPDGGVAAFVPVTNAQAPHNAGTYSIDAAGNWTFTLPPSRQSLHEGELIYDYFEVRGVDGTTHRVNITVEGTADVPKITGDTSGTVVEDTRTVARGTLNVHDPDWGQSGTDRTNYGQPRPSDGGFGAYEIDSRGHWTYRVDQTDGRVQALGEGETLTDSFTVTTLDGTKQPVQIIITGTNDAPIVTPGDLGATQPGAGKTISTADLLAAVHATDVDRGDQLSISNVQVDPQYGSFHQSGGNWVFTPAAGASHTDVPVTISVTDGHATRSATATLDVTAAPTPPTATQVHGTGTTHLSGTLTGGSGGWSIDNGHGHGVLSLQGQYGTLTINPQTGHFDYHYQAQSAVIKHGGGGAASGRHTDTFHILQHGAHTSDADVQVNINVQSVHGASGHHVDQTTLIGIDIVPVTPQQHDSPSDDGPVFEVTLGDDTQDPSAAALGLTDDMDVSLAARAGSENDPAIQDSRGFDTPDEHQGQDGSSLHQGDPVNAYLDAVGAGPHSDVPTQLQDSEPANPYTAALGVDADMLTDAPTLDPTMLDDPAAAEDLSSDRVTSDEGIDLPHDEPLVPLPEEDDPSANSG
ncbi:VCBS domain-containing protein [Ruegeria sp. HKCCA5491]|uniref:VCBS domain-containing protein n=1 Tax=Ruegeria sp. HKCCA5491 TaxID=2682986 RepID=UPI001C2C79FF